eukprot:CAMPEP_0203665878 /NCGR_PEP_ID=MMETSP0090-20130426/3027_1 /ASSEMBLY_ACC=CAM_ASM_001088 /TAXON_ID=426623 /ORGANISM="Chaetoceros affinis, Strain CCMP159" /LENGTH=624 /DNA_ID=CAMNT_0050529595 /DNA_START=31 /DNA_END=1905 /DNA_ORIENTATION=+
MMRYPQRSDTFKIVAVVLLFSPTFIHGFVPPKIYQSFPSSSITIPIDPSAHIIHTFNTKSRTRTKYHNPRGLQKVEDETAEVQAEAGAGAIQEVTKKDAKKFGLFASTSTSTSTLAFFTIGALNNIPYVVMLAGAKSISEGGTALVFLASIMPGLLVRFSAPYWFDKVSYLNRIRLGSNLMALGFILVATFGYFKSSLGSSLLGPSLGSSLASIPPVMIGTQEIDFYILMQLLGVAFCSAQGGLGESTLLALSGRADSIIANENENENDQRLYTSESTDESRNNNHSGNNKEGNEKESKSICITAFASGTGLAGPLGFAFIVIVTKVFGLSLTAALLIAMVFPVCYLAVFNNYLFEFAPGSDGSAIDNDSYTNTGSSNGSRSSNDNNYDKKSVAFLNEEGEHQSSSFEILSANEEDCKGGGSEANATRSSSSITSISGMSVGERLKFTLSLWPYMVPLFVVYAAEYALQSGVWTAIGFPVDAEEARNSFYTNSNWAYQVGVFVSRSSGAFWIAPMWVLWLMPLLQCANLVFFYFVATYHYYFWYNNGLLLMVCFYVGLLGGSVYVNGYMRINKDLPLAKREFALSTVSVDDNLGIVCADLSGLFIQSCLYESNEISGSVVSCPI